MARLRMFFMLPWAVDNDLLVQWAEELERAQPDLRLDPHPLKLYQPIFTSRPIFKGWTDPVPEWGRVRLLDGVDDYVELELPKAGARVKAPHEPKPIYRPIVCTDIGRNQ
jgi:hypothetical protein